MKDWSLFIINLNNFPEGSQHHQEAEATGRRRKRAGRQTAELDPSMEVTLTRLMVPELRATRKSQMQEQHLKRRRRERHQVSIEEMPQDNQKTGRAGETTDLLQMIRPSRLLALQLARSQSRPQARNQLKRLQRQKRQRRHMGALARR